MRAFLALSATVAALLLGLQLGCATAAMGGSADADAMRRSAAFAPDEGVFQNDTQTQVGISLRAIPEIVRRYRENDQSPPGAIPMGGPTRDAFGELADGEVRLTWVGHSTLLIELDGFRVLTDPVWSERVSPFPWVGPKRFHRPGISWDDLPRVDAVIISHDHYDHLDHETVKRLAWRNVKFFVPLGVGAHFERWGVRGVHELDWWESATLARDGRRLELVATPARHFSGRGPFDRNETLWASWVIRSDASAVYFGGDTGYFDGFREIGAKYGPFKATLIPIGAYDPAWSDIHLNPEEAVQAHLDLGNTGVFVPIHYATFNLATHGWAEPMERLLAAIAAQEVRQYALPLAGQPFQASEGALHQAWWRSMGP